MRFTDTPTYGTAAPVEHSQVETTSTPTETRHVAFGTKDAKGREIGAFLHTSTRTYTEVDRPVEIGSYRHAITGQRVEFPIYGDSRRVESGFGLFFVFYPQATRNGKSWGPCQPARFFRTEAERDAEIARYLDGATKRAAKAAKVAA